VVRFQEWASINLSERARLSDIAIVSIIAILIFGIRKSFQLILFNSVYSIVDEKHQGNERTERTKRVIKWIYDFIYYGGMTLFICYFLGDAYFIPYMLLGKGSCQRIFEGYPAIPNLPYLRIYYLIQLGNHLSSVLEQLLYKRCDLKFYEYLLHHYLAFVLIFYSYYFHYWAFGALVMITHDISDIFLASARAYEGLKYFKNFKSLSWGFIGLTSFIWAYCRIFVYPSCSIYAATVSWGKWKHVWDMVKLPYMFQYCLLFVLLLMNIYWFSMLVAILVSPIRKKSLKNLYDPKLLKTPTKDERMNSTL